MGRQKDKQEEKGQVIDGDIEIGLIESGERLTGETDRKTYK